MKRKVGLLINLIFIVLIVLVILFSRKLLPGVKSIYLREFLIYFIWFLLIFGGVMFFYRDKVKDFGFTTKIKVPKKVKRNAILIGLSLGIISNIIGFYTIDFEDYLKGFDIIQRLVLGILIGPIVEEIVFRGYIQTIFGFAFAKYKTQKIFWLPIIITSILFGLLHFTAIRRVNLFQTLGVVFLGLTGGLLSGYYKEKYTSLVPSINMHIATNMGAMFAVVILQIASPASVRYKLFDKINKPAYIFDMNDSAEFYNSLINFSTYEKDLPDSLRGKFPNISAATLITIDSSGKIINVQLDTLQNKKQNIKSGYFKEKALEVARKLPSFIPLKGQKKDTTIVFYVYF